MQTVGHVGPCISARSISLQAPTGVVRRSQPKISAISFYSPSAPGIAGPAALESPRPFLHRVPADRVMGRTHKRGGVTTSTLWFVVDCNCESARQEARESEKQVRMQVIPPDHRLMMPFAERSGRTCCARRCQFTACPRCRGPNTRAVACPWEPPYSGWSCVSCSRCTTTRNWETSRWAQHAEESGTLVCTLLSSALSAPCPGLPPKQKMAHEPPWQ